MSSPRSEQNILSPGGQQATDWPFRLFQIPNPKTPNLKFQICVLRYTV
jgi:hypothetical protein